jgi:histidyl-tRNA synthetase
MKTTTVKGTKDFLPNEVAFRDYMQNKILEVYQNSGFERISTPALEDIENLDKSEGGENLNLIFKILKRGDKLSNTLQAKNYNELSDLGLRYDLTLPLSRYYANNRSKLLLPLKFIQIDKVYRAERPQRGRDRELIQCDIDIIGSESVNSEIELIYTTAKALLSLGFKYFTIKINDRKLLKSLLSSIGFNQSELDPVCISIDKMDKIGLSGIETELLGKQFSESSIRKLLSILEVSPLTLDNVATISGETEIADKLQSIIHTITELSNSSYDIRFDFSLVRGQGYYTGTIFEIKSNDFESSIGGGGRYDNLIGKFTGEQIPAVGFSIGFERIYTILLENGFYVPDIKRRVAVFYTEENFVQACKTSENYRNEFNVTLIEKPKKFGKYLNKIKESGYYGYCDLDKENTLHLLNS